MGAGETSQLSVGGGASSWLVAARRGRELTIHLALRELAARHRFTTLGWVWPLARLMAQFGVLLAVFTAAFDLEIDDYAVYLLTGLIAWSWFSSAVGDATGSLPRQRHLLLQPRCPAIVLPLVPVLAGLLDALIALPVLLVVTAVTQGLHATALLLPVIAGVQLLLCVGLVWFTSAANVYLRDVAQLVTVALMMLFYLTPILYELDSVPADFRAVLEVNPLTTLFESYRDVLLDGRLPAAGPLLLVAAASVGLAAAGLVFFRRLRGGFVDEL